jgi:hypothetical protein
MHECKTFSFTCQTCDGKAWYATLELKGDDFNESVLTLTCVGCGERMDIGPQNTPKTEGHA